MAIGAALFVFFAYATVAGFNYDVSSIGRSSVPFLTVADHYLGGAAVLAWIAGIDGGRTGLLPAKLGHVRLRSGTPVNALLVMAGSGPSGIPFVPRGLTGLRR